jgi:poly-gamma-glutamate capsule biosynthesis protein CapA/YwtB (metallophosphatase superfamily)
MKTMIGFSAGVATGMYLSSKMSERQRTQLATRTSKTLRRTTEAVRESTAGESIANTVSKVTNAASEHVAETVDDAGARAAAAVETNGADEHHRDHQTATL